MGNGGNVPFKIVVAFFQPLIPCFMHFSTSSNEKKPEDKNMRKALDYANRASPMGLSQDNPRKADSQDTEKNQKEERLERL